MKRLLVGLVCLLIGGSAMAALDNGLVAYYPFDGDADDYSGNGYHGTPKNTPTYVEGVRDQCIRLQGRGFIGVAGDHVVLPPEIPLNENDEFTLSLWVNQEGQSHEHGETFISFDDWSNNNRASINFITGKLGFSAGKGFAPGTMHEFNKWYLYTCVYDHGELRGYQNGGFLGSVDGAFFGTATRAGIGIHYWSNGSQYSTRFIGSIDDVRIYNRALSPSEVMQLYTGKTPFASFNTTTTHVDFGDDDGADHFFFSGSLVLGEDSDGIDPASEEMVISAGPFSMEIPAGSLESYGKVYKWSGKVGDANAKLMLNPLSDNTYLFSIQAHGMDLTGWANPAEWSLQIGDDIGTEKKWLKGHLHDEGYLGKGE